MATNSTAATVTFERLQSYIAAVFEHVGMPPADARKVAGLMANADLQGSDGHGVLRLPQYVKRIRAGGINLRPTMRLVHERAGSALLDGDNGMGHLVAARAAEIAIEKARTTGVAWVSARHSNHAGPASLYARMPIAHDMIGVYFAVGNANHLPPWGGAEMLLSTNPIAAGIPAGDEPPVLLDMATTVAAYGKVKAKIKAGEMMPVGWMIDRKGEPLLDPKRADEGFLLPIGNHKGYGLALVVGLLAGTLGGAAMGRDVIDFNKDSKSTTNTGQAILAIDLRAFGDPAVFKARVDTLVRDLRNSERLDGVERIWLPGEQSHLKRERYRAQGIPVAPGVVADIAAMAREIGVEPLL
jgi:LDH2 family malate/lactate/ureidoglycolate dehydrogenase